MTTTNRKKPKTAAGDELDKKELLSNRPDGKRIAEARVNSNSSKARTKEGESYWLFMMLLLYLASTTER